MEVLFIYNHVNNISKVFLITFISIFNTIFFKYNYYIKNIIKKIKYTKTYNFNYFLF